ncbi:hypothetical protein VTK56DRAFT_479 [Thermocarpiscus australiensis]
MPAPILLSDTPTPPAPLLSLLRSHLPYSLPVLRRLQFARNLPGRGATPHTHVLHACYQDRDRDLKDAEEEEDYSEGSSSSSSKSSSKHFAAAYVDLSRAPETQCWVYSTLEDTRAVVNHLVDGEDVAGGENGEDGCSLGNDGDSKDEEEEEEEEAIGLVLAVLRRVRAIAIASSDDSRVGNVEGRGRAAAAWGRAGTVLVGSLSEVIRRGLLARGVKMDKAPGAEAGVEWEFCGKWLFRVEDLPLPKADGAGLALPLLPGGMRWDRVRREDVALVLSRTSIARQEATLLMLPSLAVRLEDGTPVAWAFMGLDGTLISLHVEEPYRRLGLAKAVACKLMRDHLPDYGDDGWGAADVFVKNHKSQGLCKSISGRLGWTLSWAMIRLSSVGDPM